MSDYNFLNGIKIAEFHMLKAYPSSALNRDDVGEQKTAYYNGYLRNRISSQCIKRAYRMSDTFTEAIGDKGIRTRLMPEIVGERLIKDHGVDPECATLFKLLLAGEELGKDSKKGKKSKNQERAENGSSVQSPAIAFYTEDELCHITEICKNIYDGLKEPKCDDLRNRKGEEIKNELAKKKTRLTVDVAAFGRMVTDNMLKEVEGAMQFSHVLSTNSAMKESDYFIACDDFVNGESEDSGAAMLGEIDYNSSCYYIHAVADLEQFAKNLDGNDNMEEMVKSLPSGFAEVMSYTDPAARQNTFEAHVLPEVLYIELKTKKRPLNRMKAFMEPCNKDVIKTSVNALANNITTVNAKADLAISHALWYCEDEGEGFVIPEGVTVVHSLPELQQKLDEWMNL